MKAETYRESRRRGGALPSARSLLGCPVLLGGALVFSAAAGGLRAEPETWDGRLDDLGIFCTEEDAPAGTWYWKMASPISPMP